MKSAEPLCNSFRQHCFSALGSLLISLKVLLVSIGSAHSSEPLIADGVVQEAAKLVMTAVDLEGAADFLRSEIDSGHSRSNLLKLMLVDVFDSPLYQLDADGDHKEALAQFLGTSNMLTTLYDEGNCAYVLWYLDTHNENYGKYRVASDAAKRKHREEGYKPTKIDILERLLKLAVECGQSGSTHIWEEIILATKYTPYGVLPEVGSTEQVIAMAEEHGYSAAPYFRLLFMVNDQVAQQKKFPDQDELDVFATQLRDGLKRVYVSFPHQDQLLWLLSGIHSLIWRAKNVETKGILEDAVWDLYFVRENFRQHESIPKGDLHELPSFLNIMKLKAEGTMKEFAAAKRLEVETRFGEQIPEIPTDIGRSAVFCKRYAEAEWDLRLPYCLSVARTSDRHCRTWRYSQLPTGILKNVEDNIYGLCAERVIRDWLS